MGPDETILCLRLRKTDKVLGIEANVSNTDGELLEPLQENTARAWGVCDDQSHFLGRSLIINGNWVLSGSAAYT